MSGTILHQQQLDNGLELVFADLSNRYYGDFHQIKIDVISRIHLTDAFFVDSGLSERERIRVKNRFDDIFESHQELKRMGVAGSEVTATSKEMVRQFLDSSLAYMSNSEFPARLIKKCLLDRPALRAVDG